MKFKTSATTLGASTRTPPGDPSFGRCQQAPPLQSSFTNRGLEGAATRKLMITGSIRGVPPRLLIRGWSTGEAHTVILPRRWHCTGMRLVPPPPATFSAFRRPRPERLFGLRWGVCTSLVRTLTSSGVTVSSGFATGDSSTNNSRSVAQDLPHATIPWQPVAAAMVGNRAAGLGPLARNVCAALLF